MKPDPDALDPEIDALARELRAARRLPRGSQCEVCGESRFLSTAGDGSLRCYGCHSIAAGRRLFEEDHLAGRANLDGLVIRLHPNSHRARTEYLDRLGLDIPPADGDPLLMLAHVLVGLATLLVELARWLADYASALPQESRTRAGSLVPPFPVVT
jgi:hypothetical protein